MSLQKLLIGGLVSILVLSFLLSAAVVALMVRGYLWRTGVEDLQAVATPVENFLRSRPAGLRQTPPDGEFRPESEEAGRPRRRLDWVRGQRRARWLERGERAERSELGERNDRLGRIFRRLGQGRGDLYLLKGGSIARGPEEDGESTWGTAFANLSDGIHLIEHDNTRWQVLSHRLSDPEYDQIVVARRWSPDLQIVRTLVGYQVLIMTLVLGLAVVAVRVLARRIATPLEELRAWSGRIGESKIHEFEPSRIEEVAELQGSFAQMGDRVDAALEAHRRFVADASHELKTPLTAISGMLELLHSRPEMSAEDRGQALAVAKLETSRMSTLVSDLLVLSRAQARRSGKREQRLLAPLVEEQLATLKVLFPAQEFRSQLDGQVSWSINSDAFARVVRNLVENAAYHAGGNPIEVKLAQDATQIALQVIDHGPGIEAEKLPRLFQRFYRLDEGRSREQGGFGLGLAIVKALVEEAGGQLTCQSVVGQGTCFSVLFKKP